MKYFSSKICQNYASIEDHSLMTLWDQISEAAHQVLKGHYWPQNGCEPVQNILWRSLVPDLHWGTETRCWGTDLRVHLYSVVLEYQRWQTLLDDLGDFGQLEENDGSSWCQPPPSASCPPLLITLVFVEIQLFQQKEWLLFLQNIEQHYQTATPLEER